MARCLIIVSAVLALWPAIGWADRIGPTRDETPQTETQSSGPTPGAAPGGTAPGSTATGSAAPGTAAGNEAPAPPARPTHPHAVRPDQRPPESQRPRAGPIDERCRPLKQALDQALERTTKAPGGKLFQARFARNAGTRLCREGQPEKGMAEFQKGLSYLEERHLP